MHIKCERVLKECVGFDWDDGNQDKNWQNHQVSKIEAEQVFFNDPLLIFDSTNLEERRFLSLGKTNKRRLLAILFTIRENNLIRVISARAMSRKERNTYVKEE